MDSLGPCRETRDQQHEYLLDLATRFQSMTFHALAARYGDSLFDSNPDLKLATAVVNRNDTFADNVWKVGHTMAFSQKSQASGDKNQQEKKDDAKGSDEQTHQVRQTEPDPDLDDILHEDCQVPLPKRTGIIPWLENAYINSRGFALGTFDPSLIAVIWKEQSDKWNHLALGYVSDIVSLVHKFIYALISAICHDRRVQSALMSTLMDGLIDRYTKSMDHAKFIICVEKDGTPQTLNNYFNKNLQKWYVINLQFILIYRG